MVAVARFLRTVHTEPIRAIPPISGAKTSIADRVTTTPLLLRRTRDAPEGYYQDAYGNMRSTSRLQSLDTVQTWAQDEIMPMQPSIDPASVLREHGIQVTAQRLAVLRAVSGWPHGTADDVAEVVRSDIGTISRQAVYDALGMLADKGLIRRIQPAGSPARFEDRVGDNHHHLICRTCGRMVDVDCAVGVVPCLTAADDSDYEIDEAEVVYWGRCPKCVLAASVSAGN